MSDKLGRVYWFFHMGMLDAYDYVKGNHPDDSDDLLTIEEWAMNISSQTKKWLDNG